MKINWKNSLDLTLAHECGYIADSNIPGGASNRGITLQTFRSFYGDEMTKHDLATMTGEQVAYIYKAGYWDKCSCDDLQGGIDYLVFDAAVHNGPIQSVRWLQEAVGAYQNGVIEPGTIGLAAVANRKNVMARICMSRLVFLTFLSSWKDFGKEWARRVSDAYRFAEGMGY